MKNISKDAKEGRKWNECERVIEFMKVYIQKKKKGKEKIE